MYSLENGLASLEVEEDRVGKDTPRTVYIKGFENGTRHILADKFPKVIGNTLSIIRSHVAVDPGNVKWYLGRFKIASRYIAVSNFPRAFENIRCFQSR